MYWVLVSLLVWYMYCVPLKYTTLRPFIAPASTVAPVPWFKLLPFPLRSAQLLMAPAASVLASSSVTRPAVTGGEFESFKVPFWISVGPL